ncbi:uncharacterized protein LOC142239951 [Haematobia irritans]|uniref:uncharacterized protein LOC142239951 n=1 Tax=Haematobia irritans TaxID=7368 RepID=UPI003F50B547
MSTLGQHTADVTPNHIPLTSPSKAAKVSINVAATSSSPSPINLNAAEPYVQNLQAAQPSTTAPIVCRPLQAAQPSTTVPLANDTQRSGPHSGSNGRKIRNCVVCSRRHPLYYCPSFKRLSHEKKLRTVVLHRLCSNCFGNGHSFHQCPVPQKCRICSERHHTLLHPPNGTKSVRTHGPSRSRNYPSACVAPPAVCPTLRLPTSIQYVTSLAPSLIVHLFFGNRAVPARALLDPCGRVSQICSSLVRYFRIPTSSVDSDNFCRLTIHSIHNPNQKVNVTLRVGDLSHVRSPSDSVSETLVEHFPGFQLADPEFYRSRGVALILGPDIYPQVMRGQIHSSPGQPLAQYTIFGWVISGPCSS